MQISTGIRVCLLLLAVCILWVVIGAPIAAGEWADTPMVVSRLLQQLPSRMQPVFRLWLLRGSSADTRNAGIMLNVWDAANKRTAMVPLESYVLCVTAAEMPAQYQPEALKCQAIAARTRAVYSLKAYGGRGCASHPECDVCTEAACCQAYMDKPARTLKWEEYAEMYEKRIQQAVTSTTGMILTYQGEPIEMLYHACSGGKTEDAAEVFAQSKPYLVSVDSPGEEGYNGFAADTVMTCQEAAQRLNEAYPSCCLSADDIPGLLRLQSTTASGRIDEILIGDVRMTGHQFRQALGLRSAMVTWDAEDGMITFHTQGYGHGVGMSQAGAQAMAVIGYNHQQILAYYYPGTVLSVMPQ